MATVSFLAGPVTRTWRCGPRHAPVQLYHNTLTGQRWLSADGVEVPGTVGSFYPISSKSTLSFTVDGQSGTVTMETEGRGSRVTYRCFYGEGNAEVPEENSVALASGGLGAGSGAADEAGKLRVTVDSADMAAEADGKPVYWFKVRSVRESDRAETVVHRRFNNFVALDEACRSAYKGSPLLASLPPLPPRGIKFLENQNDPAFVEKRRWQLQDYLYKLEKVPRIRANIDFATFIGIVDGAKECSVLFPPGPLGLSLTKNGEFTEVTGIKPLPDGKPSAPMVAGCVSIGDKVRKRGRGEERGE
jgi:hypothetical protein